MHKQGVEKSKDEPREAPTRSSLDAHCRPEPPGKTPDGPERTR
jgi:hypothetical protein